MALVADAVMVTVALPEVVSDAGETEQVVPGNEAGTLHVSATGPVKPCTAEMTSAVVPTFPVAPTVRFMVEANTEI